MRDRSSRRADVRVWEEFAEDAMPVLADLLRDLGLGARAGRAWRPTTCPARDMERLSGSLPDVRWEAGPPDLQPAAADQDPARARADAPARADHRPRRSRRRSRASTPGDTEMDLAGAVTTNLFRLGADNFKWLILASGERSQYPNVGPDDREAASAGDLVRLEVFGMLDGYHAGICRTAVVQEASHRGRGDLVEHRRVPRPHLGGRSATERAAPQIYGRVAERFVAWAGSR